MASKPRRRATASRGFVNNTILECLLDGDKYGYEIIKEVKDKTDGKVVLKEPSLYSSLKRFELKGYITSYWGDSDIGGRRHYYSLTEPGKVYYNSVKSHKSHSHIVEDIDENKNEELEQLTIENINNEIYNIEEDDLEVDDSDYINQMNFNLEDKMNQLLDENNTSDEYDEVNSKAVNVDYEEAQQNTATKDVEQLNDDTLSHLEPINDISDEIFEENKDDINEEQEDTEELLKDFDSVREESTATTPQNERVAEDYSHEYLYDHKFRKDNVQEITNGTERYVQYDLFNNNTMQDNYIDSPNITPKETTTSDEKEQITANKTETEINKEIPLIKESEVEFFNWNELKRQATSNKTSFTNSQVKSNTNKYSIDANSDLVTEDYKTTDDLHKLYSDSSSNNQNKIFDNVTPVKEQNKIFDNVKDRIELSDAVMGNTKKTYNDEPELTDEQIEVLNQKFKEKFDQIADSKVASKQVDYKKILGNLYYKENNTQEDEQYNQPEEENNSNNYDYSALVDNDIDDEKIVSAINKANKYNNDRNEVLQDNDGYKYKPYTVEEIDENDDQFVQINKVRFVYGSILALLILLQTAVVYIILKSNDLVYYHDIAVYVIALVASIATFVGYLIPYLTKQNERKLKYYNLNYHLMFGVLYLFCGLILTYALDLALGLNSSNALTFISRLLLPGVLLTNYVIAPLIYKLVLENKNIDKR